MSVMRLIVDVDQTVRDTCRCGHLVCSLELAVVRGLEAQIEVMALRYGIAILEHQYGPASFRLLLRHETRERLDVFGEALVLMAKTTGGPGVAEQWRPSWSFMDELITDAS